jgi:dTDP-4-amino-4,6-dideoxygalactose transaminase
MDRLMAIASQHDLYVIEDAAQAIDSTYKGRALGSIGHLGCFSFHETKNVISGEGGALLINDSAFIDRAEIIWEKGTNRSAFFRGEVDKYNWVDLGSSFLPSEITAAFLLAQLEKIEEIQERRHLIWDIYHKTLSNLERKGWVSLPHIPSFNGHNAHIFYLVCRSETERNSLLDYLNSNGVNAIFHYIALHKSPYFTAGYQGKELMECDRYTSTLVRLPIYFDLSAKDAHFVAQTIVEFYTHLNKM